MRIALVTVEYVTEPNFAGGLSSYTHKVALGLKKLGHTPEVFVYGWGQDPEVFEHKGIRVERCPISRKPSINMLAKLPAKLLRGRKESLINALACSWGAEQRIRERHQVSPFDLIHYTHLEGTGVFLRRKIPSVVRLSSFRDLWKDYGYQQNPGSVFGEDRAIHRAHGVIAPSNWVGDYVAEKFARPVKLIESPFTPTATEPDDSVFNEHFKGIKKFGLYFGSITNYKGVYVLAEALTKFLRDNPDYHFVFVGREIFPEDPDNPPWQRISQTLGDFKDRIHRLQSLKHNQLFPIIEKSAFVALPSLADNLPNTALESMALGKVLIGTDGRSFEQLIDDNFSGFLCQPGDSESLLGAMQRAVALSDDEAAEMGARARERINQLRPEVVVAQLLEFYREVIAAHPKNWQEK